MRTQIVVSFLIRCTVKGLAKVAVIYKVLRQMIMSVECVGKLPKIGRC